MKIKQALTASEFASSTEEGTAGIKEKTLGFIKDDPAIRDRIRA